MTERIAWFVSSYVQRNLALIIVILAVLLVRLLMKRMPKKLVYCLWAIVGIRMLVSFQIPSPVSIYQIFPWADPKASLYAGTTQQGVEVALADEVNPGSEFILSNLPGYESTAQGMVQGEIWRDEQQSGIQDDPMSLDEQQPEIPDNAMSLDAQTAEGSLTYQGPGADPLKGETIDMGTIDAVQADEEAAAGVISSELSDMANIASASTENEPSEGIANKAGDMSSMMAKLQAFVWGNAKPIFAVWLAGMLVVFGIGMASYARIRRLVGQAVLLEGNVWECDGITTPFVLGIVRPRIFVPFRLEEEHKKYVLEHERQHVKRLDPLTRLLAYALLAVYWMNPLVWISYVCFVRDQEMRCDEAVLSSLGAESKKGYGLTLLAFATEQRFVGFSPVAFGESDAEKRIKNVLNYKKPGFWAVLAAALILLFVAIVCLTSAKNKKEQDGQSQTESTQSATGTEGKQEAEKTVEDQIIYQSSVFADLDGDGVKEQIQITDYTSGKSLLKTNIQGKAIDELTLQSVQMIRTDGEAFDLTGDGCEELILLQSSPMLASTYNWPGDVTVLQVKDGAWRQLSDRFIFAEHGTPTYQESYPKRFTDGICVGVRIEQTKDGAVLRLLYPRNLEVSHGTDGVLRMDCIYQGGLEEGWFVKYVFEGHDYMRKRYRAAGTPRTFSILIGDEPGETSGVTESGMQKIFSAVPFQELTNQKSDMLYGYLKVEEDGTFTGLLPSGDKELVEEKGHFVDPRKMNDLTYQLTAEGSSLDSDRFLLYLPGSQVAELPYKVIRSLQEQGIPYWDQYHLEELPCYALLDLDDGEVYLSAYLQEYVGERMETQGIYGELSYPVNEQGGFSMESVVRLCADACGTFVQKVKYPRIQTTSFSSYVRNDQLASYLEYKTKHFPHLFPDGDYRLELKQWELVTVGEARVLHVTGVPRYSQGSSKGAWGIIHFLIDMENGQQYIRDWYWESKDSRDESLRGPYDPKEGYSFWDRPVNYRGSLEQSAVRMQGEKVSVLGLGITCEETRGNQGANASYDRAYFYNDSLIGRSRGYGESRDYADDLDDDGVTELICYSKSMSERDYDDVTIFRRKDNIVYMGRLTNPGLLSLENSDTLSAEGRIEEHYDPEKHLLFVTYPVRDGGYASAPFTYDDMTFTEYSYVEPRANSWKEAYANFIRRSEYQSYSLIYLDDDEIPELYCQEGDYPQRIVSLQDGKIIERYLERNAFCYLEKKGIYYTEGGNMGYFPFEIVSLKDGEFTVLASGYQKSEYIANAESTDPDHLTEFITYDWNGHSVTEEECDRNIDSLIDRKKAIRPNALYSMDEILKLLGMEIMSLAVG